MNRFVNLGSPMAVMIVSLLVTVGCTAEEAPPEIIPTATAVAEVVELSTEQPVEMAEEPAAESAVSSPEDIDALFEEIYIALLERDPESATYYGVADLYGIGDTRLNSFDEAYQTETYALIRGYVATLEAVERDQLTAAQQISLDVMLWDLRDRLAGERFRHHDYLVNQLWGVHNNLIDFMVNTHPLNSVADAEDYITRLQQSDEQFAQAAAQMRLRVAEGITPPRWMVDTVLNQMRGHFSGSPTQHTLYVTFVARLAEVDEISTAEQERLAAELEQVIAEVVQPAYENLHTTMTELRSAASDDDGVWHLPDGNAYYAYMLSHHTTTDLTAAEIHELGLQEVARIQGEMIELFEANGFGSNFLQGVGQMYGQSDFIQISNAASREEALAAYETAIAKAEERLGHLFGLKPQSPLAIVPVPDYFGGGPGAYYTSPPLDGSRPGTFWVNLSNGRRVFMLDVPTLAIHEGIPGHHFQRAVQRELQGVPTFRRTNGVNAFAEGWALYVEKLAAEYGMYDDDPFGDFGRLQAELFRAVRLVVDTGIHDQGWSREEAVNYMSSNLGWPRGTVAVEVDRYIAWPGQATSYKIGQMTFERLRLEAQEALGDQFDIAEYHALVLQNGDIPLPVLEQVVAMYVAEKLGE